MIVDLSSHRNIELNVSFLVKKSVGIITSHPDDPVTNYEEDLDFEIEGVELVIFGIGLDVTDKFKDKFSNLVEILKNNF